MDNLVYTYRGEDVVIVYNDDLREHNQEELEVTSNGVGSALVHLEDYDKFLKPLGVETLACYDDSYSDYSGNTDIDYYKIPNIEFEQGLMYCFATCEYGNACSIEMQYGVITDRYYDWTSQVSRIRDRLFDLYGRDEDYMYFDDDYKEIEQDYYEGLEELQKEFPTSLDYNVIPFEELVKDASYGR